MSNTHIRSQSFLQGVTAALLLLGVLCMFHGGATVLAADVLGPGSSVLHQVVAPTESTIRPVAADVPAVADGTIDAELRLVIGMLLVIAGFGCHALCLLRADRLNNPGALRARRRDMLFMHIGPSGRRA